VNDLWMFGADVKGPSESFRYAVSYMA